MTTGGNSDSCRPSRSGGVGPDGVALPATMSVATLKAAQCVYSTTSRLAQSPFASARTVSALHMRYYVTSRDELCQKAWLPCA